MRKILWLDIEAADSKTDREGAVHQISYVIDIDGQIVAQGEHFCAPFKGDLINMPSLEVCGVQYDTIKNYPPPTEAFKSIVNAIHPHRKMVIGGYNSSFYDNPVFFNWWWKCAKELKQWNIKWADYVWADALDVRSIAIDTLLEEREKVPSFKLVDLAKYLAIPVNEEEAHNSSYDIQLTREIYYKLKQHGK